MMANVHVMPHEWSKFELPFWIGIRSSWRAPDLNSSADPRSEMTASWGEGQGRDISPKREMMECHSAWKVSQNGMTIFVHRQKEISSRSESKARYVSTMSIGQGVGLVANSVSESSLSRNAKQT